MGLPGIFPSSLPVDTFFSSSPLMIKGPRLRQYLKSFSKKNPQYLTDNETFFCMYRTSTKYLDYFLLHNKYQKLSVNLGQKGATFWSECNKAITKKGDGNNSIQILPADMT